MGRAGQLRQEPTAAESALWALLRGRRFEGVKFRRQHAIGRYVVDFCAPAAKLVIEVDGSEHLEQSDEDAKRTEFLESEGYRVLQFWNNEVLNDIDGVVRAIEQALDKS